MKKTKQYTDKSAPYRTMSLNKITAPVKHENEPKGSRTVGAEDLRLKRGKSV